jgi:hypothetical protein
MAHDENGKFIGYGEGDTGVEVAKVNHRMAKVYPVNSRAVVHGVVDNDPLFSAGTKGAVIDLSTFINADPVLRQKMAKGKRLDRGQDLGVADLAFRTAIGAYLPPPAVAPKQKWPAQGVSADSRAFLNPPDAHSFEKATNDFATEGFNLYSRDPSRKIWALGYSMGGVSVCKFLNRLRPEWRPHVEGVITFGDPSMPPEGSLNGDMPGGGISRLYQPEWCRDRYWSYAIDGDWYPQATGLLPFFYQVLTKAELSMDFAVYLFTVFPMQAMQQLIGAAPSSDPLAGVLGGLGGMLTTGPMGVLGSLLGPMQILGLLPQLITLLFDAVKFMTTNAHGLYADPAQANWDGLTGVDHAARMIREHSPGGATLFLFPGTWSNWDQLFQFDVWTRVAGDVL